MSKEYDALDVDFDLTLVSFEGELEVGIEVPFLTIDKPVRFRRRND